MPILSTGDIQLLENAESGRAKPVVGYPGTTSFFRLRLRNLGRTVAELTNQGVEWRVVQQLPEIPAYVTNFPFTPGYFCEPEKTPLQLLFFPINLQPDEVKAISEETKFLWVYGFVTFQDFIGQRHEHRWCAKWQGYARQPDGLVAALGFVHDSTTPAEYTKRT